MTADMKELEQAIDRLELLECGLQLGSGDSDPVAQLSKLRTEAVSKLKAAFVKVTGEDPWD